MQRIISITKTITILVALLLAIGITPLYAATPSSGSISTASPSLQWQGALYVAAATPVPEACPAVDPANAVCDHFFLNIDLASNFWDQNTGQVSIRIEWASDVNDFDLYVYRTSDGALVDQSAAGGTTSEEVALTAPTPGVYEVRVVPFLIVASDYRGSANLLFTPGPPTPNPTRPTGGIVFAPAVVIDPQRTEGEPLNHVDKNGFLWESGPYGLSTAQSFIHKSVDNGDSYHIVSFTGLRPDAPPGGGDTDIITDDQGFAYFSDLELANIGAAVSNDGGNTWRKNPTAVENVVDDRQWFAIDNGPTSSASDNTVFLTTRQIPLGLQVFSTPGSTGSTDPVGGLIYQNAAQNVLTVAPDAVCGQPRFDPINRNLYLVCDRGDHVEIIRGHVNPIQRTSIQFQRRNVPPSPGGNVGDIFPALAVDRAGNLFAVWADSNNHNVYMTASRDQAETWTSIIQVNGDPANTNVWAWAAGGSAGKVDIVWYGTSTRGDPDNFPSWLNSRQAAANVKWFTYFAQVSFDFTTPSASTIYQVKASEHPTHYGQICQGGLGCTTSNGDRTMADFLAVAIDRSGAARIVIDDTTNQHHGAALFELRQIAGPGAFGGTISGTAPKNPMNDLTGDAQWPHFFPAGSGPNQRHMDFKLLELSQKNSDSLNVRMQVLDASSLLPPAGAQSTIWLTRWQSKSIGDGGEESYRIFYVGAKSVAGGTPTFFSGTGVSAGDSGVPGNGCQTTTPRNCKIILYPQEKAQSGTFNQLSGEIIIQVPLADVGSPRVGDMLFSVTALSFGEITGNPLFQDVDATRALDFTITKGKPVTERKVTGGGYIHVDSFGGRGSFGLVAHTDNRGKITYIDHATGPKFHSAFINSVTIEGNRATIKGMGFADNIVTNFVVTVEDKAEPGAGVDTFSIQLGTGYSRSGVLQGGNIQLH